MSGFCKHIIATLIYVNRNEDLEVVSCTDLEQKWGKEKKGVQETYKPEPFKEFCHPVVNNKYVFSSSSEVDRENFALLSTGVPDSALTRFLGRSTNPSTTLALHSHFVTLVKVALAHAENSKWLKHLKNQIEISTYNLQDCCQEIVNVLSSCNVLEVATKYEQGSSSWSEERKLRITGSTCYSIFTFKKEDEWENKAKKLFFPKHLRINLLNMEEDMRKKPWRLLKKNVRMKS
ncbi:uncharacterized protein LOC115874079 [Sitophilus oryzae]|uniref:Uncharacterized protein LOC115874079 n=1 Tax=Sitophilus oryzae TaxID=7048 RepID=A0A6J2X193_SITOR|nr:uncharacterized protein LOC115874079 [Sitophilus oryzae]